MRKQITAEYATSIVETLCKYVYKQIEGYIVNIILHINIFIAAMKLQKS